MKITFPLKSLVSCGGLLVCSFFAHAAITPDVSKNDLVIEAIADSQGTVIVKGVPMFQKSFKVTVENEGNDDIDLTGYKGCYKAVDEKGNRFNARLTQLDLLGTLPKGHTKWGGISFTSKDKSVYDAKFVEFSTKDCINFKY